MKIVLMEETGLFGVFNDDSDCQISDCLFEDESEAVCYDYIFGTLKDNDNYYELKQVISKLKQIKSNAENLWHDLDIDKLEEAIYSLERIGN